jgi:hypothetical protein
MAGQPHRLRANRMPPLVPVAQVHPVGRDADDPEPAPTPRHLHPGTHSNPAQRLGPFDRRDRSYPSGGVRRWAPRRVGLGADHCAR